MNAEIKQLQDEASVTLEGIEFQQERIKWLKGWKQKIIDLGGEIFTGHVSEGIAKAEKTLEALKDHYKRQINAINNKL